MPYKKLAKRLVKTARKKRGVARKVGGTKKLPVGGQLLGATARKRRARLALGYPTSEPANRGAAAGITTVSRRQPATTTRGLLNTGVRAARRIKRR